MVDPVNRGPSGVLTGLNELASNPGVAALSYVRVLASLYTFNPRIPDPAKAPRDDPSFWRKALRDPVIRKAVMKRIYMVAGKKWTITPGDEAPEDVAKAPEDMISASILEDALKNLKLFGHSRALLATAIFRGAACSYIQGEYRYCSLGKDAKGNRLAPRMWWVPTELVDVDPFRFELRRDPTDNRIKWYMGSTKFSPSPNPSTWDQWEVLEHPEWFVRHVYEPTEQSLRYGQGLQDALEFSLWAKQELWRNFLVGARRAGRGFLDIATNDVRAGSTTEEIQERIQDWKTAAEGVREDGDLIHSPDDQVKLLEMPIDGLKVISEEIKRLNEDITSLILFGVLPTGSGSAAGSNARAEEEANQGREAFHFDQSGLSETLTDSVVKLTWDLNRENFAALSLGNATMGRFSIVNDAKPDPKAMAQVVATLMAAGATLRLDEVLDRCGGWTVPKPGEAVLQRPTQSPELPEGDEPPSSEGKPENVSGGTTGALPA